VKLTQDFRSELYGPWEIAQGFLVEQFDHLIAQIVAGYNVQHTKDDAHGAVTAASLIVNGLTRLAGPGGLFLHPDCDIAPVALTASVNDYNPGGWDGCTIARLSAAPGLNITGLKAPAEFQTSFQLKLLIPAGANNITLKHQNAASNVKNRLELGGADYTLGGTQPIALLYDIQFSYWRKLFG